MKDDWTPEQVAMFQRLLRERRQEERRRGARALALGFMLLAALLTTIVEAAGYGAYTVLNAFGELQERAAERRLVVDGE